ncbi:sigma-54-dependent transcriptional regulator [Tundrisphaera sp. TA3]|uniref:sigma-54-dependent transcriptional regulator n=1 Tax=Tundrisphaera sp. TA3 TaxID=3435775 RepID=UPI003EB76007
MSRILVVDDEEGICWAFREFLGDEGHRVEAVASAEEALRIAGEFRPDAVMLDVRLPGMDGIAALPRLRDRAGGPPVVVMTAFGDLDTAVRAVEAGAFDYLIKPFDLDQASAMVRRALEAGGRVDPPGEVAPAADPGDVPIGASAPMQALFRRIAMVAATDVPVLITGESGTGKELVARALHRYGARRDGPFVPVCLPALSPSLVEAELFGHAKGSFTGAAQDRKGVFELAHGGTVLLDEIGDAPLSLQVKLLRAIENREVAPVGDGRARPVDIRVLAATNRSLPDLVAAGSFREDLYFRLAAFPIHVPALRERVDDIPALAAHFLARCRGAAASASGLGDDVVAALKARPWPGNVRELRNAVEHAAIMARGGPIRPEHLPAASASSMTARPPASDLAGVVAAWAAQEAGRTDADLHARFLEVAEPPLIRAALDRSGGNRAAAAQRLGIDRATLRQKMKRYGMG